MIIKRIFNCVVILFCLVSCHREQDSAVQVQEVVIPTEVSKDTAFLNHFELAEVVPLETTPESAISFIHRMIVRDNYILIVSRNQVLMFDRNGKFLRQIGCPGKGPGEYHQILDVAIDEQNNQIVIYSDDLKLIYYSEEGQYLRQERQKEKALFYGLLIVNGVNYYYNPFKSNYEKVIYRGEGDKMVGCGTLEVSKTPFIQHGQLFVQSKSILFTQSGSNTIYELKDSMIYERFHLIDPHFRPKEFDQDRPTPDALMQQYKKGNVTSYTSIRETSAGVFLRMDKGNFIWINPQGEAHNFIIINVPEIISGAILYVAHTGKDDFVAFEARANRIVQRKGTHPDAKIESLLQSISEDDNPVLLFYKSKQ